MTLWAVTIDVAYLLGEPPHGQERYPFSSVVAGLNFFRNALNQLRPFRHASSSDRNAMRLHGQSNYNNCFTHVMLPTARHGVKRFLAKAYLPARNLT